MTTQTPQTTRGWLLQQPGKARGWDSLTWNAEIPLRTIGPNDVLVKLHAVSLNYRDVAIVKGTYPSLVNDGVVPGADGAGEVVAVGSRANRFKPGDRVVTFLTHTGYFSGLFYRPEALSAHLGSSIDGTFREYAVMSEEGLVAMPSTLSWTEAAGVAGVFVTAWNCLFGGPKPPRLGDCVLVQGSGGVSLAVLQLAVASGVNVIATSSSAHKAEALKKLGARHVINYHKDSEWGTTAKKLSPGGLGCSHVIDVVGDQQSFRQSLEAVALGGEICVVGYLATPKDGESGPSFLDTLFRGAVVRGVMVGNRQFLEDTCRAIDGSGLKPVVDPQTFALENIKEAYQYLSDQKNFGKVVIEIS